MKKEMTKEKGITLIALIITIIVMLILAAVVISIATSEDGIIQTAEEANKKNDEASEKEQLELIEADYSIQSKTQKEELTVESFLNSYKDKGVIKDVTQNDLGEYVVTIDKYSFIFQEQTIQTEVEEIEDNTIAEFKLAGALDEYVISEGKYYPIEIYNANNDDIELIKFYKKEKNESDYTNFTPANVKLNPEDSESSVTEISTDMIISTAQKIYFELSSEKTYILKVEYILKDGSKKYAESEEIVDLCFIEGTKVLTEQGLVNIEELETGMKVFSKNIETGKNELKSILSVSKRKSDINTYKITIMNENIESTGNHPYFVKNKGFVEANNLSIGDILEDLSGNEYPIQNIEIIENNSEILLYNISVEDNHNYFVGENNILVHNSNCPTF